MCLTVEVLCMEQLHSLRHRRRFQHHRAEHRKFRLDALWRHTSFRHIILLFVSSSTRGRDSTHPSVMLCILFPLLIGEQHAKGLLGTLEAVDLQPQMILGDVLLVLPWDDES